jgi:hypothetical protein
MASFADLGEEASRRMNSAVNEGGSLPQPKRELGGPTMLPSISRCCISSLPLVKGQPLVAAVKATSEGDCWACKDGAGVSGACEWCRAGGRQQ